MADQKASHDSKSHPVANEAAHHAADAAAKGSRAATDATTQATEAVMNVTRQGTQAGAEAMRRTNEATAETLRRGTQAMAEGQRRIADDAAQRFQTTSRTMAEGARDASEDMTRFFSLPRAAEGGLREMQESVAGLIAGVVQTNLRATEQIFRLASPAAMVELQQRFMREYLDALMQGTATLVHAIRRTADGALPPLERHVEQRKQARLNDDRAHKSAA